MSDSPRKRRRLIDESGAPGKGAGAVVAKKATATPHRPLSALAPPSPALIHTPSRRRTGGALPKALTVPNRAHAASTIDDSTSAAHLDASAEISRFGTVTSDTSEAVTPRRGAALRSALVDPLLVSERKPPDRWKGLGFARRGVSPSTASARALATDGSDQALPEMRPAPLQLHLRQKADQDGLAAGRGRAITKQVHVVDRDRREPDSMVDLSSPRKRKGGGVMANGLAQHAAEVLHRIRTDHALWQHSLARRLLPIHTERLSADAARQQIAPDLRLRLLSLLPGLSLNRDRLMTRCAIIHEETVPSSDSEEAADALDTGLVIFSLTMHPAAPHQTGPSLAASRSKSNKGPASYTIVNTVADLSLVQAGVEVWAFEPWTTVSLDTAMSPSQQQLQALICTRFIVLSA